MLPGRAGVSPGFLWLYPESMRWIGIVLVLGSATALAQDGDHQARASDAYDQGAALFVNGRFEEAGQWFMTAYRLAPSEAALLQGMRAYREARRLDVAGTLAVLLVSRYPSSASVSVASNIIDEAKRVHFHLMVECGDCRLEVDDRLQPGHSLFLEADSPHEVVAHFGPREVREFVSGSANEERTLQIAAPPEPIAEPETQLEPEESEPEPLTEQRSGREILPPAVFYSALGVTAVVGAVTIWATVDAYSGIDAFEEDPTIEAWRDGHRRERRMKALIGVTAGLAAVTAVMGALTRFSVGEDTEVTVGPAGVGVDGRF